MKRVLLLRLVLILILLVTFVLAVLVFVTRAYDKFEQFAFIQLTYSNGQWCSQEQRIGKSEFTGSCQDSLEKVIEHLGAGK